MDQVCGSKYLVDSVSFISNHWSDSKGSIYIASKEVQYVIGLKILQELMSSENFIFVLVSNRFVDGLHHQGRIIQIMLTYPYIELHVTSFVTKHFTFRNRIITTGYGKSYLIEKKKQKYRINVRQLLFFCFSCPLWNCFQATGFLWSTPPQRFLLFSLVFITLLFDALSNIPIEGR